MIPGELAWCCWFYLLVLLLDPGWSSTQEDGTPPTTAAIFSYSLSPGSLSLDTMIDCCYVQCVRRQPNVSYDAYHRLASSLTE